MKKSNHFLINYFKPNTFVENIEQIDVLSFKKNNIKLVVCDLDNTLAPHFNRFPTNTAINFCEKIKNQGIVFILASNNFKKRVKVFADKIKPDHVIWSCKKPLKHKINKILKKYNFKPEEIVFIGDQFLIDVFCANRFNAKSILVFPLTNVKYKFQKNKILGFIENKIYKKISLNNMGAGLSEKNPFDFYDVV
uniref:Haloacid dehalogenase n=1 Tax=uncultured Mycoplasmataceae bacterium TaxID=300027 RepID=A0A6G9HGV9_9MOLU|nr:haloacid dehalogenase [uncultured Mycoplasmataceae bacterium]